MNDIHYLITMFKKAYGGIGIIDDALMNQVYEKLHKINYAKHTKEKIAKVIELIPDNHLGVHYLNNKHAQTNASKNNINLNKTKNNWIGIIDNSTYIIAITSFPSGKWKGFEKFVIKAKNNAKNIVIDLRNNGGGDDAAGKNLVKLITDQTVPTPYKGVIERYSKESTDIYIAHLKAYISKSTNNKEVLGLKKHIKDTKERLKQVQNGEIQEFHFKKTKPLKNWQYKQNVGFKGKIYILQNKYTASSAEGTIDFFEYVPNVLKIGTNTSGTKHFGNIGIFDLPNLKLRVSMPTTATLYRDKRFIEKIGITPDIKLDENEDAFEYFNEILKKNN